MAMDDGRRPRVDFRTEPPPGLDPRSRRPCEEIVRGWSPTVSASCSPRSTSTRPTLAGRIAVIDHGRIVAEGRRGRGGGLGGRPSSRPCVPGGTHRARSLDRDETRGGRRAPGESAPAGDGPADDEARTLRVSGEGTRQHLRSLAFFWWGGGGMDDAPSRREHRGAHSRNRRRVLRPDRTPRPPKRSPDTTDDPERAAVDELTRTRLQRSARGCAAAFPLPCDTR